MTLPKRRQLPAGDVTEGRFCTLLSVLCAAAFNSVMLPGRNAGRRDIGQPRTDRQRRLTGAPER